MLFPTFVFLGRLPIWIVFPKYAPVSSFYIWIARPTLDSLAKSLTSRLNLIVVDPPLSFVLNPSVSLVYVLKFSTLKVFPTVLSHYSQKSPIFINIF